jgi:hypothetical protein
VPILQWDGYDGGDCDAYVQSLPLIQTSANTVESVGSLTTSTIKMRYRFSMCKALRLAIFREDPQES